MAHPKCSHTYQFRTSSHYFSQYNISYSQCLQLSETVKQDMGHIFLVKKKLPVFVYILQSFCVNFFTNKFSRKYVHKNTIEYFITAFVNRIRTFTFPIIFPIVLLREKMNRLKFLCIMVPTDLGFCGTNHLDV